MFYIDKKIWIVKHTYGYNTGSFMSKYTKEVTPDVFENFGSNISETDEHFTRNATQKLLYITFNNMKSNFQIMWFPYFRYHY